MTDGECSEEYLLLKDFRIDLNRDGVFAEEGFAGFSLCFWIYLTSSARPSSVVLRQVSTENEDEVPFLAVGEKNKLILFPLTFLHNEASFAGSSFPWSDIRHVTSESECPLERWVHVGCKATQEYIFLYFNGELSVNMPLSSSSDDHILDNFKKLALAGGSGYDGGKPQGYVYNARVLPLSASIKEDFVKNPPVKLSLNGSCTSDALEVGSDGVWSIVGGKASCRRNFSVDVVLLDAVGRTVHKDLEITASLVYADNGAPIEKTHNGAPIEKTQDNSEAPLLVGCEGLEYSSTERPVALFLGRATFKLKISQLSSKSDNRLFSICFRASQTKCYPFFEACSPPIRCISRSRIRPVVIGKRPALPSPICDRTHVPVTHENFGNGHSEIGSRGKQTNGSSKRSKVDSEKSSRQLDANGNIAQNEQGFKMSFEAKSNNLDGTDSCPSDTESIDARNSEVKWLGESIDPTSDVVIFRYCVEATYERSLLLKEIIKSSSNEELATFADQVCLYSGCLHHRYPISISKQLIQEGNDTWNSICRNGNRALWVTAIPEINKRFMSISQSTTRGLSGKDLEVLRGIAGCGEELGLEHFVTMWQWLYPVAYALSKAQIHAMWECALPKWIEGFITVEEAESSLKGLRGVQKPGTFVLRFPTSRSWPHPDAGGLVVTYIGPDLAIHHKLLSIDHSEESGAELLQNLLLKEPELSQLGRVFR